jgi:hypothetical protein
MNRCWNSRRTEEVLASSSLAVLEEDHGSPAPTVVRCSSRECYLNSQLSILTNKQLSYLNNLRFHGGAQAARKGLVIDWALEGSVINSKTDVQLFEMQLGERDVMKARRMDRPDVLQPRMRDCG